jgi:hypothetical protein
MGDYYRKSVSAVCPDGTIRKVSARHYWDGARHCLAADTAFSVPASVRVRGVNLTGYVTGHDTGVGTGRREDGVTLEFRPHTANPWPFRPTPPPARYEVSGMDYCAPGMERLRNQDEFILCAYVNPGAGWRALRSAWLQDIQSCERSGGFDYEGARRAVAEYAAQLRTAWRGKRNPLGVERSDDPAPVLLYVRDLAPDAAMDGPDNI